MTIPGRAPVVETIAEFHADVSRRVHRLEVIHAARLVCRSGCSSCCVDDLTVFEVEAAHIRARHAGLLTTGTPHPEGACAFLDGAGGCRIYADRPYVCRTQGLPLRWIEESEGSEQELRDICPLNEHGEPIEALDAEDCWTLGPSEERLGRMQLAAGSTPARARLRDLFVAADVAHSAPGSPPTDGDDEPPTRM